MVGIICDAYAGLVDGIRTLLSELEQRPLSRARKTLGTVNARICCVGLASAAYGIFYDVEIHFFLVSTQIFFPSVRPEFFV